MSVGSFRFKERDGHRKSLPMNVDPESDQENGSNSKLKSPSPNIFRREFVSVKELYGIIKDETNNVLVIDCRPENDFAESKLQYAHCVNVPEEIIRPG